MNDNKDYYNVPIYIEKAIKKLFKVRDTQRELYSQIEDYMKTHNIPTNTSLHLLKYFPPEDIDPNQMQLNLNEKEGIENE